MEDKLYTDILAMVEQGYTIQQACLHYDIQTIDLYRYIDPIQAQELAWAKAISKLHANHPMA